MVILQLHSHNLASLFSRSYYNNFKNPNLKISRNPNHLLTTFSTLKKIRALGIKTDTESEIIIPPDQEEKPAVNFAFVSSVLLPDGTPDVHYRTACGGQKLRDIMLDNEIELYGPYARPLLNCSGGGTCGTCIVEVVEGRELLSPRTDKEKEKLKRNPKNWRLACQTIVGEPNSRGLVVIQQLPEWKDHQWTYGEEPPEAETVDI